MICRNHVDVSEGVRSCSRCGSAFCRDCLVDIGGAPYCATCKTEQLLDLRSGVSGTLDLAGFGRRFVALFVDKMITIIPAILFVLTLIGAAGRANFPFLGLFFLVPSILAVIYQAAMLQVWGQTLGKMAVNVKVVRPNGSAISAGQAWGRELSRAVLGLLYIIDYLPAFFTKDRRALHDMLANTRVVNWSA
jgi:Predicted membrane protein/domain